MEKPWSDRLRARLTGAVTMEGPLGMVAAREFPSRQALVAFVFLAAERTRLASADELGGVLWPGDDRPDAWDNALSALCSRLRGLGTRVHPDGLVIERRFGTIQLAMPPGSWVDIEAAQNAIDEAEGHWRAGRVVDAYGAANVAACIASEPLLPDVEGPWMARRRQGLRTVLTRALRVLSEVSAANGEPDLALDFARRTIEIEPLAERHAVHLMRLHARLGNRGEALRAYAECRERLREELGTSPSPETEAVYLQILRA